MGRLTKQLQNTLASTSNPMNNAINNLARFGITKVRTKPSGFNDKENPSFSPVNSLELDRLLMKTIPSAPQCAEKIIESVMSDGLKVVPRNPEKKRKNEKQKRQLEDFIHDINFNTKLAEFIKSYLTYGDAYFYIAPTEGSLKVGDINVLDPLKLNIRVDKNLVNKSGVYKPVYYDYRVEGQGVTSGGSEIQYDADEIIRWKRHNIDDPVYGLSPLSEDKMTLSFGIMVLNHNLKFFENMTKSPLVLSLDKLVCKDRLIETREYLEEFYSDPDKAWSTLVVHGGAKLQELTLPDQTQFFDMLNFVTIQACGLFNIPPDEIGIASKSGLNSSETRHKDFIKTNINRKKQILSDKLNYELILKKMKIEDWILELPKMDSVNPKQRMEIVSTGRAVGQLTMNEGRKQLGLDRLPHKWADEFTIGDAKSIKAVLPYVEYAEHIKTDGVNLTTGESNEIDTEQSGRPDLDDRDRETDDSANRED